MVVSYPLKATAMISVQNDVLSLSRCLSISWQNDGNLLDIFSWILIATPISGCIEAQGNAAILIWRDISHEMNCLPVKTNSWMASVQHILESSQVDGIKLRTDVIRVVGAILQSFSRIMDVQLRIHRVVTISGEERANSVNELSMELEGVRGMAIIDRVIQLSANRSHGQSIVVLANVLAKFT